MKLKNKNLISKPQKKFTLLGLMAFFYPLIASAQTDNGVSFFPNKSIGFIEILTIFVMIIVGFVLFLVLKIITKANDNLEDTNLGNDKKFKKYLVNLNSWQIEVLKKKRNQINKIISILILGFISLAPQFTFAQTAPAKREGIFSQPGVLITLVLIFIPLFLALLYLATKVYKGFNDYFYFQKTKEAEDFAAYISLADNIPTNAKLERIRKKLNYSITSNELSGNKKANDTKGLLKNISSETNYRFFASKRPAIKRPKIDPELTKLVLWFLGTAVFWLLIGSSIGEYVGIKFIAPDADTYSWLSIGRLRAVHTNLVFWAWSTIGIMGLGYYIVPMVSNTPLNNIKNGWKALIAVNLAMFVGAITLMAGINNAGGEYREIIWPIMAVWAYGLLLTVTNFIKTIAKRTTHEIYISNWFIVASYIFILIVAFLSYIPMGQDGIGETIVQGYYMHQAVGMWFMFSMLGILYYILPQQVNKPIYSYSLGVLAFWSQILFYTTIGTHHFVFSSLPWWLQTVAIIGSVGMLIPVTSGTINYLMTFKGSWSKVSNSYSLPFLLVGVVYYFTGSFQGTAEAFRSTNLIWHFTDFTIAHSHITMYGIITFLLFGSIYAIVPRLTGQEPPQLGVGAHFWLALIGLQFYTIPLMIGGTLKGLMWAEGKPFIDSVVMMGPYWLWRAIGGSLMWLSHIVLVYNMYKMIKPNNEIDVKEKAFEIINQNLELNSVESKQ
ncbi:cbb3-type cytochrome c oxidase subunit I [Flavobacterium psychrophilum]|uniref:cbb3-type cytochrome c oxidase subunit I n=1 Tax=Flavobacterium psychrophilum TaxID=96345 RepID=UPI001C8F5404|nr:cbb3-type cytochrome c oxidase subunit I [Flavobacterium psychrophilum]QZL01099.1 cbb3-type cytochrome c oxidase subunit I [Flavobacterium psychrophilum]